MLYLSYQIRILSDDLLYAETADALEHSRQGAVRHLYEFQYLGAATYFIQVCLVRVVFMNVYLGGCTNGSCGLVDGPNQLYGLVTADGNRKDGSGKKHRIPHSQYRECLRNFYLVCLGVCFYAHYRKYVDVSSFYLVKQRIVKKFHVKLSVLI